MSRTSVTLRDLAKELNLSTATVSRALNGFPEVNLKTRQRVEQVAAQMGYHPNASARRLANGLVGAFGLVPWKEERDFIDPLLAEFLDGVTSVLADRGTELSLLSPQTDDRRTPYIRAIAGKVVDAFIVTSPTVNDIRVDELIRQRFPFVLHGRTTAAQPHWSYDIDNFDGFYRATQLLTDFGHRRIAFLGGLAGLRFAVDRLAGTRKALAEKGLTLSDTYVRHGAMTEELGYLSGRTYLTMPAAERPTAFLCNNIYIAVGLLRAAREQDLRCPEDLSVIVHDDRAPYLRSEFSDPPLTAVQSSIREAGVLVTQMTIEMLANPQAEPRQIVAPVDLVVRQSVSHPRDRA